MASRELVVAKPITLAPEERPACKPWKESSKQNYFRNRSKNLHSKQETIGSRFGTLKHVSGKNTVELFFKFGMGPIDVFHFSSLELVTSAILTLWRRSSTRKSCTPGRYSYAISFQTD